MAESSMKLLESMQIKRGALNFDTNEASFGR